MVAEVVAVAATMVVVVVVRALPALAVEAEVAVRPPLFPILALSTVSHTGFQMLRGRKQVPQLIVLMAT